VKEIKKAEGKLGILIPGMGAVTTTFMAGIQAIRKGFNKPIGTLTQIGKIGIGKRTDKRRPFIKDIIPLAELNDLEFLTWDVFEDNAYIAAKKCGVLNPEDLEKLKDFLTLIKPNPAVFNNKFVEKLDGHYIKGLKTHRENVRP